MIREISAKSILRKHKLTDSWFLAGSGMNLYRGCMHNCAYCDGRAEGYHVQGDFGHDIEVKINAVEILKRELDPARKRSRPPGGFCMIGGGVCDSYQAAEKKYELTRKVLELISGKGLPVHMLTKSTLIKRDADILSDINKNAGAVVSMSFSSCSDEISRIFEPGVPPPSERLETLRHFKSLGIPIGMYLMPVMPFITDTPEVLEHSIKCAKETGIDFIIFSGMTLKEGRQKDYFFDLLEKQRPELKDKYIPIYTEPRYGTPAADYTNKIYSLYYSIIKKYKIPSRMPLDIFERFVNENERVRLILEHMDYYLSLKWKKSPFRYSAYSIGQLKVPVSELKESLQTLKGVGSATEKIIKEILETGSSSYYRDLILYKN